MTEKQIEALRAAHPWEMVGSIRRLLEERKRLLEALRAVDGGAMWQAERWAEAGGSGGPEMRDYLKAKTALEAAVAFAEEEAP